MQHPSFDLQLFRVASTTELTVCLPVCLIYLLSDISIKNRHATRVLYSPSECLIL